MLIYHVSVYLCGRSCFLPQTPSDELTWVRDVELAWEAEKEIALKIQDEAISQMKATTTMIS